MKIKDIPMVPNRKAALPIIYGNTPSFLGVPVLDISSLHKKLDVIFIGVPWEGTITWGSFSGCELSPRVIRHAAARYGGFLPEYELDLFDFLSIADVGDISVFPNSPDKTMKNILMAAQAIYKNGSIPFVLGGDHSISPPIIEALGKSSEGSIGIVHFDAHLDNAKEFGEDQFARCSPLHRIAQNPKVRKKSIVQIGIRGPRNSPSQFEYAKQMGAKVFHMGEIRKRGMEKIIDDAINIAHENTKQVYVTICSDCIDAAYNPGGPADFNGLVPYELFTSLYELGKTGIAGLDYVEIYPPQDPNSFSSHLASWAIIYALVGMAARKKENKGG
jgi:guanidinopropionase